MEQGWGDLRTGMGEERNFRARRWAEPLWTRRERPRGGGGTQGDLRVKERPQGWGKLGEEQEQGTCCPGMAHSP